MKSNVIKKNISINIIDKAISNVFYKITTVFYCSSYVPYSFRRFSSTFIFPLSVFGKVSKWHLSISENFPAKVQILHFDMKNLPAKQFQYMEDNCAESAQLQTNNCQVILKSITRI